MDPLELARSIAVELIGKSGVQEFIDPEKRIAIAEATVDLTMRILYGPPPWPNEIMATSKQLLAAMDGTPKQIVFGNHAGDFSPTAANDLRITTDGSFETDCEIALTGVANNAARMSAKFDFGSVRAPMYKIRAAVEMAATPTAGNTIECYFGFSPSATAGTANPAGLSGSDGAYTGQSSNLDASVKQLIGPFDLVVSALTTATIQVIEGGTLVPYERYGILVVYNKSGAAFHSDDVEIHIVLDPVFVQGQAA